MSDIFALPTTADVFSIACIEAMAMEKPVVISDVGGIKEIVKDGENGFLVPRNDREEFRSKLLVLISSESLRRNLGANGREFVKNH